MANQDRNQKGAAGKALRYLQDRGMREFASHAVEKVRDRRFDYQRWIRAQEPSSTAKGYQKKLVFKRMPDIIVMILRPEGEAEPDMQTLQSVRRQTYQKTSLSDILTTQISDDAFLLCVRNKSLLTEDALFRMAEALAGGADAVYADEDSYEQKNRENHYSLPLFKPDYNPDLLRSNNYICHFLMVKQTLLRKVGGIHTGYEGAQDYDFILRCTEQAGQIVHVPEILYHWRTHRASTADNPASKMYAYEAGKKALEDHLKRTGIRGEVSLLPDFGFYRVQYPVQGEPKVSVIIPNKDQRELLKSCIESLREKTAYKNYEILIVENNSTEEETFRYYKELSRLPEVRLLRWKKPFNYSAINNFAARHARGEYLLFLNNDVTIREGSWMSEMLGICQRDDVGAVGAKLLYPDNTIQHAGCVIGMGGIAGAMFVDMPAERSGYLHKASILQDLSAVTAACMMTRKDLFLRLGGFEEKLTVAFNDMDYCLRVCAEGLRVVYDPYACLYHWESKTRGDEDTEEKVRRFQSEIEFFRTRWIRILKDGDPNYNKNLSLTRWNYSLKALPGLGAKKGNVNE